MRADRPFPGDQDFGAGGALRIRKDTVFLDDERAPQRHHHQVPRMPPTSVSMVIWK
jgi:hypothetical protein